MDHKSIETFVRHLIELHGLNINKNQMIDIIKQINPKELNIAVDHANTSEKEIKLTFII